MTDEEVLDRLRAIEDPCSRAAGRPTDIVAFGLVDEVEGGSAPRVRLRLTEPSCLFRVWFARRVRAVVGPSVRLEFADADELWAPVELRGRLKEDTTWTTPGA